MNTEGKIYIQLHGGSAGVTIRSGRPVLVSRVFEGKPVAEVRDMVPLLFNICGRAQGVAAARAIENVQGRVAGQAVEARRDVLVALESLREHLWRILMDWPPLLGQSARVDLMAPLNQSLNRLSASIDPVRDVAGGVGGDWRQLRTSIESMLEAGVLQSSLEAAMEQRGWQSLGAVELHALPALPARQLRSRLDGMQAAEFVANPVWDGRTRETGPMSRQQGHPQVRESVAEHGMGLQARLIARLVEVEALLDVVNAGLDGDRIASEPVAEQGVAQLETARGRLVHCVDLDGDRVCRYRIVAPTEWNFHPHGVVASALSGLGETDPRVLEDQARLLIHSIDPCVGFELTVR